MALPALLLLEGEEPFSGVGMGHEGTASGIMAISALTAGFPDLVTDPSYGGKIVCFTYPHVGNAGVVSEDLQGDRVAARAIVTREITNIAANRLATETMDAFLKRNAIPAMEGVDTRAVSEIVTRRGMVRAVMGTGKYADEDTLRAAFATASAFEPEKAGAGKPYEWTEGVSPSSRFRVVVHDFGVKKGFLRRLAATGSRILVAPSGYPAEKTMAEKPDGVVFSAGTGVPETRLEAIAAATALLGKVPLWGIGIGAGILAAACGARCVTNGRARIGVHPVGRTGEPSVEMTSHCREFWIEADSLAGAGLAQTHFHLNDGAVEGFQCSTRRILGTLFHPEAEPGPRDSLYLFDRFQEMMRK